MGASWLLSRAGGVSPAPPAGRGVPARAPPGSPLAASRPSARRCEFSSRLQGGWRWDFDFPRGRVDAPAPRLFASRAAPAIFPSPPLADELLRPRGVPRRRLSPPLCAHPVLLGPAPPAVGGVRSWISAPAVWSPWRGVGPPASPPRSASLLCARGPRRVPPHRSGSRRAPRAFVDGSLLYDPGTAPRPPPFPPPPVSLPRPPPAPDAPPLPPRPVGGGRGRARGGRSSPGLIMGPCSAPLPPRSPPSVAVRLLTRRLPARRGGLGGLGVPGSGMCGAGRRCVGRRRVASPGALWGGGQAVGPGLGSGLSRSRGARPGGVCRVRSSRRVWQVWSPPELCALMARCGGVWGGGPPGVRLPLPRPGSSRPDLSAPRGLARGGSVPALGLPPGCVPPPCRAAVGHRGWFGSPGVCGRAAVLRHERMPLRFGGVGFGGDWGARYLDRDGTGDCRERKHPHKPDLPQPVA